MSVESESLQQRLDRIERERREADDRYNAALTALDRAIPPSPDLPHPPPGYDTTGLDILARTADLLPSGPPAIDGSLKGRLRAFVWRLIGPPLESQRQFNAALVDHLTRNLAVHEERRKAAESTIALQADRIATLAAFHTRLIQYLQTLTAYVDTRDRSALSGVHILNAALDTVTSDLLKRWESLSVQNTRARDDASRRVDEAQASLADVRATAALAQQTALSLKREVQRLLARPDASSVGTGEPPAPTTATPSVDLNAFKYLGFENEFRGAPEDIRQRLEMYLPLFEGRQDVLDIGCGRGEFLDLLRARGVTARGIDINDAMVEESRARGLDAEKADALGYLSALPDGSLGGVFAAQVIEHLPPDYLTTLIEVAAQKIRPGGLIVLETINPTCWVAFFESYIRDLTHVRPLHPETMQYLLRVSGFGQVRVQYSAPVPETSRLSLVAGGAAEDAAAVATLIQAFNRNMALLNSRMFTSQDYAVIGTR